MGTKIPFSFLYFSIICLVFSSSSGESFISAFSYAIGFYAYVKALSIEDASLIAPLYNSSLLWLFILSVLFLDDVISIFRIIGALLIFFGFFFLYSGKLNQKLQKLKENMLEFDVDELSLKYS